MKDAALLVCGWSKSMPKAIVEDTKSSIITEYLNILPRESLERILNSSINNWGPQFLCSPDGIKHCIVGHARGIDTYTKLMYRTEEIQNESSIYGTCFDYLVTQYGLIETLHFIKEEAKNVLNSTTEKRTQILKEILDTEQKRAASTKSVYSFFEASIIIEKVEASINELA